MKVSLVVPAYNEEESIAKTLESLKAQTYKDYELIVVDNNSKDNTGAIAKKYTNLVFLETKKGYINAVNRGVSESRGEILSFCDADTIYPNDWLAKVMAEFEKSTQVAAVYGSADTADASLVMNKINGFFYTAFLVISRFFGLDNTSGFNFVFRKAVFEKIGGYDPKFQKMSPDIELGRRMKKEGQIVFNPAIKVHSSFRRFQEGGVVKTSKMFLRSWWEMVRGKEPSVSYEEYNKIKRD
jgi:glycosyltransferase involved in cell wall biosynthesis